jgi:NTP pyrophosphatase (non-canonical NTP hydrolase)
MIRALPREQHVNRNTPQEILIPTKIAWLQEEVLELMRCWLKYKTDGNERSFKAKVSLELADMLHFIASIASILEIDLAKAFIRKYKINLRRKHTTFVEKKKSKEKYYDLEKDFGFKI